MFKTDWQIPGGMADWNVKYWEEYWKEILFRQFHEKRRAKRSKRYYVVLTYENQSSPLLLAHSSGPQEYIMWADEPIEGHEDLPL